MFAEQSRYPYVFYMPIIYTCYHCERIQNVVWNKFQVSRKRDWQEQPYTILFAYNGRSLGILGVYPLL